MRPLSRGLFFAGLVFSGGRKIPCVGQASEPCQQFPDVYGAFFGKVGQCPGFRVPFKPSEQFFDANRAAGRWVDGDGLLTKGLTLQIILNTRPRRIG